MVVTNASYKKVRCISEGNFHGCYASNKAEKFKFRRLSQGIESCAQAQVLKLRKEEKALHKLLDHLEKEKEKHRTEHESNRVYLQNVIPITRTDSNRDSNANVQTVTNDTDLEAQSESVLSIESTRKKSRTKNVRNSSILSGLKSSRHRSTVNTPANHAKNNRRHTIHVPLHDVTPFYMEHGYSHYHHDPHYDALLHRTSSLKIHEEYDMNEPRWKKQTNLSRLRLGCHNPLQRSETDNLMKHDHEVELDTSFHTQKEDELQSKDSADNLDNSGGSSVLVNMGSSDRTLPATQASINAGADNRIITPLERLEVAKYQRKLRSFSLHHPVNVERPEMRLSTTTTAAGTSLLSSRALLLKKMAQNKLRKGFSLQEIANDPYFGDLLDECDDQRVYPAYEPEERYSFEDFRSLRKCKYLRLSDLNIQSLKMATLENLVNK